MRIIVQMPDGAWSSDLNDLESIKKQFCEWGMRKFNSIVLQSFDVNLLLCHRNGFVVSFV